MMTNDMAISIQRSAMQAAKDVVLTQIAKGAPNKGMNKARHGAVVADVVQELLESFDAPENCPPDKWARLVMRAAFSGSLLNASQLRQDLEKSEPPVLMKEGAISSDYGIED